MVSDNITLDILNKNSRLDKFNALTYQQIVIVIACFIFTVTMVLFWYITPGANTVYPPVMSNCPVGWTVNRDGTCNIPPQGSKNLGNLYGLPVYKLMSGGTITYTTDATSGGMLLKDKNGNIILGYTEKQFPAGYDVSNIQIPIVDFTDNKWGQYGSVLCANYDWAMKNNIKWEGVTNYNQCN